MGISQQVLCRKGVRTIPSGTRVRISFRLPASTPGNFYGVSLYRRSSSIPLEDTFTGNVAVAFIEAEGKRWRL